MDAQGKVHRSENTTQKSWEIHFLVGQTFIWKVPVRMERARNMEGKCDQISVEPIGYGSVVEC